MNNNILKDTYLHSEFKQIITKGTGELEEQDN